MKTYKFLLISTLLFNVSCTKVLDTVPDDRLSSELFWKNDGDAKLAVNALYRDLDGVNVISWDGLTEIAHTNGTLNEQYPIEQGTYDTFNTKISTEWSAAYTGIAACNYFLANVDKITSSNITLINQYKGEARALRAYQYIKLAALFGDAPLVTQPVDIAEASQLSRTPVADIWKFVDNELEAAAGLLPATYTSADIGRVTKGAAWALKARADLLSGNYQKAVDACNNVTGYSLYPTYATLFTYAAESNKEVILDKQFLASSYANAVFSVLAPYSQKNGQSTYVPTKAVVDAYETANGKNIADAGSGFDPYNPYTNRDPRLKFSIFVDGDALPSGAVYKPIPTSGTPDAVGNTFMASTTGFAIKKYINASDYANTTNCGINIILLRYAEVLLTYAEAKIELNQIDQSVYDAINLVRNGRTDVKLPSIPAGQSQLQLRAIVRHERTIELAFEGLHLYDMRRWKTGETVMAGAVFGMTYKDASGNLQTIKSLSGGNRVFLPKHYLWPVPQNEINLDHNLTQNPGW
ncbi:MAG: RagB/SusD family nutrient uptake outer membrane protein [Bacteroidota bacterium]